MKDLAGVFLILAVIVAGGSIFVAGVVVPAKQTPVMLLAGSAILVAVFFAGVIVGGIS